ncbi:MAG: ferrous iron transport protein B [Bdellovibrionota bacterium]
MSKPVIALAGTPNCGKSALFNALTGSNQKLGNFPGVTVEKKLGTGTLEDGKKFAVIDLPGTYSLNPSSPDEKITSDVLVGQLDKDLIPDLIVAVADAANLENTLGLIIELKKLQKPVIAALNMIDLAQKRGLKLDLKKLSHELGCKVVTTIAIKRHGIENLLHAIQSDLVHINKLTSASQSTTNQTIGKESSEISSDKEVIHEEIQARFHEVDRILNVATLEMAASDKWTARLDKVLLHPIFGPVLLVLSLIIMFQSVFSWAEAPMNFIETSIAQFATYISQILPEGLFNSLISDGIIAGVGSVLVFLPQILILFFFIFLMEGSGYMARAAFIMDRLMAAIGLQGRSFVPLLSSFACAIPGVMAARTVKSPKERLITIMIAPLMTCSARLPVYVLLIAAFIPNKSIGPFLNLQGLTMFGLFLVGILSAIIMAFIFKHTLGHNSNSSFLMELPTYKWPSFKHIAKNMYLRAKIFIKRAGTLILAISITLWVLSTFPKAPENWQGSPINYSYAGRIGHFIEPIVKPLGFDWRIATGLIPGFAAREVMVGALATVFSVEAESEEEESANLTERIQAVWGIPTGLSLLVWYIFSPQCLATLAVVRRETNRWKWPALMMAYMLGLAFLFSFLTYRISSLFFN